MAQTDSLSVKEGHTQTDRHIERERERERERNTHKDRERPAHSTHACDLPGEVDLESLQRRAGGRNHNNV